MEKAAKSLPDAPMETDRAAKRVQTDAEPAKPAFSLGTLFPEFKGKSLFGASEAGSGLFAGGEVQSGLFGSFKPGTLFAKPAEEAQADSEEEQGVTAEPTEDEAELLSRNPNPHVYTTFYTALARREVANFRADQGDALGPGAVTIEQSKDDPALRQLVMRNKAKKILYSCFLLKGADKTVRLKGKPGLSLFGYVLHEKAEAGEKPGEEKPPVPEKADEGEKPAEEGSKEQKPAEKDAKAPKADSESTEKPAATEEKAKEEGPSAARGSAAKSPWRRENVKLLFLSAADADDFFAELSKLSA